VRLSQLIRLPLTGGSASLVLVEHQSTVQPMIHGIVHLSDHVLTVSAVMSRAAF
jgi:hypothetical protein